MTRAARLTMCMAVLLVAQGAWAATAAAAGGGSDEKSVRFGLHGSYATDGIDFGVGGRLGLNISSVEGLGALATFDYFFGQSVSGSSSGVTVDAGGSAIQVGAFATYSFEGESVTPYVGAGLSYFRVSGDASASADGYTFEASVSGSETSLGVLGGVRFGGRFFGEARYHFGDASHLTISAGILF